MRKKTIVLLCLIVISLSQFSVISFNPIPLVKGTSSPSDGDAWTENDNATYPWVADPSHNAETLSFTTSDKYVGSYAFNITHTDPWIRMRWYLDFGVTDLSSYEALEFWIKPLWIGSEKNILIYVEDSFLSDPRFYVKFKATNNTWSKVYIPTDAFIPSGSNPSWTDRELLHFYVSDNIGASDGTTVLIDGLNFRTHTVSTPVNTLDRTWLSNFYYAMPAYREVSNIVYEGNSYTTLLDWINKTDGSTMEGNLEAEALGQSIGALAYLYKEVSSPIYLTKAKLYADWLLQFQGLTGLGNGIAYDYNNATSTFDDFIGSTVSGWCLWGMSVLYDITQNSTYKTFSDNLFDTMVSDTWFWNSTVHMWDTNYDNVTGWNYAGSSGFSMSSGGSTAGIGAYYRYVEQNSTAETIVNDWYANIVTDANNAFKMGTDFEQSMYNAWGMYEIWQAFSNTTYRDEIIGMMGQFYHAYSEINANASINNYPVFAKQDSFNHLDGWGGQVGLPMLMVDYETSSSTLKQKAFEKYVFDYVNIAKGDAWLMEFRINDATTTDKSWSTGSLFLSLGLLKYMKRFVDEPFILLSDGEITSTSYSGSALSFTVSGTGTTTTEVYGNGAGKPVKIEGADSWTWDPSGLITVTIEHSSNRDIVVSWRGGASSSFELRVHVSMNKFPFMGAVVDVDGENKSTDLFGDARFDVGVGSHDVTVYLEDQSETREIFISRDQSVGFDFEIHIPTDRSIYIFISIPLVFLIVIGAFFFGYWRRR